MSIHDISLHIDKAKVNLARIATIAKTCDKGKEWLPYIDMSRQWISEVEDDVSKGSVPITYLEVADQGITPLAFDSGELENSEILKCIVNGDVGEINANNTHYCSFTNIPYHVNSYHFYKQLGFALSNVVVVGANGCGKTTLANTLAKALNVKNGIVIPAVKLLIVPSYSSIPNHKATLEEFERHQFDILDDKQTYNVSRDNDFPIDLARQFTREFRNVISTLISEQVKKNNSYSKRVKNGMNPNPRQLISTLDSVLAIWNDLIEHRIIDIDDDNNLFIKTDDGKSYEAYKMSDGERVIFYFSGRVLLAPDNALIIVDEPEGYLHEAIVNKLWDRLEYLRNDCTFIYLTHDLHFASSRRALKYWMRDFQFPNTWDIRPIEENDIPQTLLMEILGSKKRILFCEGDKINSLDSKIYEILFPNYTIIPVQSCREVIAYTKTYNNIPGRISEAYGIVDSDFRDEAQIQKFAQENIFTTDVAEVENLFLDEHFILCYAKNKGEKIDIEKIKNGIIAMLAKDIDLQTSLYVSSKINFYYSEANVSKGKNQNEILQNLSEFNSDIKVEEWYNARKVYLETIVANKDYNAAIRVYNNKGLQRVVEQNLGYAANQYRKKALDSLASSDEAKRILKRLFPKL